MARVSGWLTLLVAVALGGFSDVTQLEENVAASGATALTAEELARVCASTSVTSPRSLLSFSGNCSAPKSLMRAHRPFLSGVGAAGADAAAVARTIETDVPDVVVVTGSGDYAQVDQGFTFLDAANRAISLLAVLIGGIGVTNTMVMSIFCAAG